MKNEKIMIKNLNEFEFSRCQYKMVNRIIILEKPLIVIYRLCGSWTFEGRDVNFSSVQRIKNELYSLVKILKAADLRFHMSLLF